jgi:hypothetical protein
MAALLAAQGDLAPLRALADTGDISAAHRWPTSSPIRAMSRGCEPWPTPATARRPKFLAELLAAAQGDLAPLRALADSGDYRAAERLAELLAEQGDLDGLRARADAGDYWAAGQLADLLAEQGDLDGLRARADAGDRRAAGRLARVPVRGGRRRPIYAGSWVRGRQGRSAASARGSGERRCSRGRGSAPEHETLEYGTMPAEDAVLGLMQVQVGETEWMARSPLLWSWCRRRRSSAGEWL